MRGRLLVLAVACIAVPATAQVAQRQLDLILHEMTPQDIAIRRSACAMGRAPKLAADSIAAGIDALSAARWCVAVLTRQGRDRTLGYVRDPRSAQLTPAIAFDSGFVGGYLKREALPSGSPTMATLLPIAERCLEQRENDKDLCNATGQILGMRASHGEIVAMR